MKGSCPRCSQPLRDGFVEGRPARVCGACGGQAVGLTVFRDSVPKAVFRGFLGAMREKCTASALNCPACRNTMGSFPLPDGGTGHSCGPCQLIWFDAVGRPASLPKPKKEAELPVEALRILAEAYVQADNEREAQRQRLEELRERPGSIIRDILNPGIGGWLDD